MATAAPRTARAVLVSGKTKLEGRVTDLTPVGVVVQVDGRQLVGANVVICVDAGSAVCTRRGTVLYHSVLRGIAIQFND